MVYTPGMQPVTASCKLCRLTPHEYKHPQLKAFYSQQGKPATQFQAHPGRHGE
jgi:hypothetical protein